MNNRSHSGSSSVDRSQRGTESGAMRPCFHMDIVTSKKVRLNGLWWGPKKARTVVIMVHGLTASAFSMGRLRDALIDGKTAVLTFNNRGFEQLSEVKRGSGRETVWVPAGAGREVFTDCVDDIQGAINAARKAGVSAIYLAGHSTGCQKIVYWASRGKRTGVVKGIVLLAPLSDYAGTAEKYKGALSHARRLVKVRKGRELMPQKFGHWFPIEAQRFVSLYGRESKEEIFSYASGRTPTALKRVKLPIFALFAGSDEHADRPVERIAEWFRQSLKRSDSVRIIPRAGHSFRGAEASLAAKVRVFMKVG